jgi:hypothetical protein
MSRLISAFFILALLPSIFFILFIPTHDVEAAATCGSGALNQNGIRVVPSHGTSFYIDTSATPKLDAGYVGYSVVNETGSTQSELWTEISNFSGSVLNLANPADTYMKLPSLAHNATGTSYFFLKATGATQVDQAHTIKVYDKRPDLEGATMLYECDFTFAQVKETIKAASNKVADNTGDAIAISLSDSTPELGQLVSVTVEGSTGVIGNGAAPDGSIVWLTPAAISTWPTRALRLESVSVVFDTNRNWNTTGDQVTFTNQLLITNAKNTISNSEYRATYTFRVVGLPQSSVAAVPVAQISSGTQTKHTDTGAAGATVNLSFASLSINAGLTKNVTATSGLEVVTCTDTCDVPNGIDGTTYAAVPYRLIATSTTATAVTIDEFVDTPANGVIYDSGSALVTDIGRTNVSISDPVYLESESAVDPRPYHFIGPFTLDSSTSAFIDYTMWVPVGTYANTAYARLGDVIVGASGSAMSEVTVTSNGTSEIEAIVSTVSLPIVVITDPATIITSTTATLNGTVDPNGVSPLTGAFTYSTSPTLIGATTVTATTPASGDLGGISDPTAMSVNLTGLSTNTTYYYRAVAGDETGEILSFTTLAVVASPTVTTEQASNILISGTTLNGSVSPNLTPITAVQFIYSTSQTFASGNTIVTLDDGEGATLTIGGSSEQVFETQTTSLVGGTTYYFKIRACTASSGTYPTVTCSSFVDGTTRSFVASNPPTVITSAATSVGATIATINGVVNPQYSTTSVTFEYGTSPTLSSGNTTVSDGSIIGSASTSVDVSLSGLDSATTYYFRVIATNQSGTATGSILNFTTLSVNRTLTIDAESYEISYSFSDTPPTLTATPSEGGGAVTFFSETESVCTVNPSTGLVSFESAGTCSIGAVIAAFESYSDATASSISFEITSVSRTLTIDAESFEDSYVFHNTPPTLSATPSTGGGDISFTSLTSSVCTVGSSSGVVVFVDIGSCEIEATITAFEGDAAATSTSISFSITEGTRSLTIDDESYDALYDFDDEAPSLTATPSNGSGSITFTSNTPSICTVGNESGEISFVTTGTCSVFASISASDTYASATSSPIFIEISASNRILTIDTESFVDAYTINDTPPIVVATSSVGGGDVRYSSLNTEICILEEESGEVTFVSQGTCQFRATISEDGSYLAATSSVESFAITGISRTITIDADSFSASYKVSDTSPTIVGVPSIGGGTKTYTSLTTSVCTINTSTGKVTFITSGTCMLRVSIAASGHHAAATSSSISFTVTAAENPVSSSSGGGGSSIKGCTDKNAINYARRASRDDGSCKYPNPTQNIPQDPAQGQASPVPTSSSEGQSSAYTPSECTPYLTTFIRLGAQNDVDEVKRLQVFLNEYEGELLFADGLYKEVDAAAVRRFQQKYSDVLAFWNITQPTGYVYITTQKAINKNYCEKTKQLTCPYFTEYLQQGDVSDEVSKVRVFLNNVSGANLDTASRIYDTAVAEAVRVFQAKYAEKVLKPWGLSAPTGRWYQSTKKSANDMLGCFAPVRLDNGMVLE